MKRTTQKTLTGEIADYISPTVPFSAADLMWLPVRYLVSAVNLRRLLFFMSFLTYGIGDGLTAVFMMERTGVMRELNPIARFMFASYGGHGVLSIKIWFTFVILFLVWAISTRKNSYWAVNGFLSALCVGGITAMGANLMAAYGIEPPSPGSIIMTFLFITVLFVVMGDMMDRLHGSNNSISGASYHPA